MAATYTPNKNLAEPQVNVDTGWGTTLNSDLGILDGALGGVTTLNTLIGSPTLTTMQYQNLTLKITGTLTGNVSYLLPTGIGGIWVVNNAAVQSSFTMSLSVTGGTPLVLPALATRVVYCDGVNFFFADSQTTASEIPTGSVVLFYQAAAPTGWTKVTTANNGVLRVVFGTTGGSGGGTVSFSSMFNSGNTGVTGPTTLTVSQMPAHSHSVGYTTENLLAGSLGTNSVTNYPGATANATSDTQGGGQPHTHPLLDLRYYDIIFCSKN
jgi:hypothetical protein